MRSPRISAASREHEFIQTRARTRPRFLAACESMIRLVAGPQFLPRCFADYSKCHAIVVFLEANAPDPFCDVGAGRGAVSRGVNLPAIIGFPKRAVGGRAVGKFDRAIIARSQVRKVFETRYRSPVAGIKMSVSRVQNHLSGDYTPTACRPKFRCFASTCDRVLSRDFICREIIFPDRKNRQIPARLTPPSRESISMVNTSGYLYSLPAVRIGSG